MTGSDVLIPTHNPKPDHLKMALESLIKQKFHYWKALIHDDCSDIDVASMIQPFLSDARITFKKSPHRLGIGGNWNACVASMNAPIVAFLFQDDVWNPDYLAQAIETLEKNPSVGFVSMEHSYMYEGSIENKPLYEAVRSFRKKSVAAGMHQGHTFLNFWIRHELHPNVIGEPSFVVMRRKVMEEAGKFLTDMPQFLDTEYWLRLLTITDWYNETEKDYGSFRVHSGAASAMNQQSGQGLFDRLRCFEMIIGRLQGNDRTMALEARNGAVETMVAKFFGRRNSGKKTSAQGSGQLLRFCLRHPLLIGKSILKYFS